MQIGNTTIIFRDCEFKKENLKSLYDFCNDNFQDESLFYSSDELKKLKQDKSNIFIKI